MIFDKISFRVGATAYLGLGKTNRSDQMMGIIGKVKFTSFINFITGKINRMNLKGFKLIFL